MTDTKTPSPSDAELFALIKEHLGLDKRMTDTVIDRKTGRFHDAQRYRNFTRAVLDRWGTQAAREPVAYLHDDGYWTPAKTEEGRKLNDRLHFAGSEKIGVHLAAPQPAVAAGWVMVPADPTLDMGWAYLDAARESEPFKTHSFNHDGYRAYCQELESQVILDCMTHVQNPAEIEHVADNVSKNGAESNTAYPELPEPVWRTLAGVAFSEKQMRDFADRTHALRIQQAGAEPLHITHGPLMRHAAYLLRSRKPVMPEHESVAAELELAVDGHPTPSGEPSAEWLEVLRIATSQPTTAQAAESVPAAVTVEDAIEIAKSLGVREFGPNTRNWSFDYAQLARFVAALTAPQADSAPLAAPADIVVLEAALRAIHQAIDLIGEPDTERLRTVRRVLRGAVVVAEDSTAPQADSQPAPIDMVLHCPACGDSGARDFAKGYPMTETKTPSPSDALPCPFCGHSGPLEFQDGSTHRWGVAYCANCGASSGETRRDYPDTGAWHLDAVAQWNTRAQPAPVRGQKE